MASRAFVAVATFILFASACATQDPIMDDAGTPPPTTDGSMAGPCGSLTKCGDLCVSLKRDAENCGQCGRACKSGEVCVQGGCALQCGGGTLKCNATCVSSQSDPTNCGSCGNKCAPGQVCSTGKCAATCQQGLTDCSSACVDLQSDEDHCGSCGNACAPGQLCSAGKCVANCQSGWSTCSDGDGGTTCVDTNTDPNNCGSCGNTCPNGFFCSLPGPTCGIGCFGGTTKCGNLCKDTSIDPQNCGGCNVACGMNQICSSGKCCAKGEAYCNGMCRPFSQCGGTVRDVNGTVLPVTYVPCGNGQISSCTLTAAQNSCTGIGMKLVSHASNGTNAIVSLGATVSCNWSISYFTNFNSSVAGQCLVGVSNAEWSSCCGLGSWHGNIVTVPSTLGQQFGYVLQGNSGYDGNLSNVTGTTWGCQSNATGPPPRMGCNTYYVACR